MRWRLATDRYIKELGYPRGTLVASSGEVTGNDQGPEPFTESSRALKGRDSA